MGRIGWISVGGIEGDSLTARHARWQARKERSLTDGHLAQTCSEHIAQIHLSNVLRVHAGPRQCGSDYGGTQCLRSDVFEYTLIGACRSSYRSGYDDGIFHISADLAILISQRYW